MNKSTLEKIDYKNLINMAIKEPGQLSKCYELFHDYSLLNSLYIMRQLKTKNLPIEPIKGYKAWNKLNRTVKKELLTNKTKYGFPNGIEILFPVIGYYPLKDEHGNLKKDDNGKIIMNKYIKDFNYSSWHFSFSQTNILDKTKPCETLTENRFHINIETLCKELNIEIIPYNDIDGNCQGYALPLNNKIALNPIAENPIKTAIHEIAHVLLKHAYVTYDRNIKEVEAETVAYIVLSVCNCNEDLSNQRGYIQHWLGNNELTDDISKRIISTSSKILEIIKKDSK